jgi:hypothetical protein
VRAELANAEAEALAANANVPITATGRAAASRRRGRIEQAQALSDGRSTTSTRRGAHVCARQGVRRGRRPHATNATPPG